MMTIAISSCDEDTTTLGNSLTENIDKFKTVSQSYAVHTQSLMTDSVLAHTMYHYLGSIKDPETGALITSDYMTQFNILETEYDNPNGGIFPNDKQIMQEDRPIADSCVVRIMISRFQGDSLAAMKLQMCELEKPVPNGSKYYSDFDPEEAGYLRTTNAININKSYTVSDLTMSDSLRNVLRGSGYYQYISIPLNGTYIDKQGNKFEGNDGTKKSGTGFGSYLINAYYDHPSYFRSSIAFANKVFPGFYFKSTAGLGSMLEVANTQIIVYYHYTSRATETVVKAARPFISTEEVLQTNHITNDKSAIKALEQIDTCTFLKSPSALFTEVEIPVDSIIWLKKKDASGNLVSHEKDTLISAKITFQQIRQQNTLSTKLLEDLTDLLMVPRDSVYTFFEGSSIPNNVTTYLATYNSVQKTYTFNSLTGLISNIWNKMKPQVTNPDGTVNLEKVEIYKKAHPNWNKVVLVPVDITLTYTSTSSSTISSVYNSMAISSVRLVGGKKSRLSPVTISVMYNKNE